MDSDSDSSRSRARARNHHRRSVQCHRANLSQSDERARGFHRHRLRRGLRSGASGGHQSGLQRPDPDDRQSIGVPGAGNGPVDRDRDHRHLCDGQRWACALSRRDVYRHSDTTICVCGPGATRRISTDSFIDGFGKRQRWVGIRDLRARGNSIRGDGCERSQPDGKFGDAGFELSRFVFCCRRSTGAASRGPERNGAARAYARCEWRARSVRLRECGPRGISLDSSSDCARDRRSAAARGGGTRVVSAPQRGRIELTASSDSGAGTVSAAERSGARIRASTGWPQAEFLLGLRARRGCRRTCEL